MPQPRNTMAKSQSLWNGINSAPQSGSAATNQEAADDKAACPAQIRWLKVQPDMLLLLLSAEGMPFREHNHALLSMQHRKEL